MDVVIDCNVKWHEKKSFNLIGEEMEKDYHVESQKGKDSLKK